MFRVLPVTVDDSFVKINIRGQGYLNNVAGLAKCCCRENLRMTFKL